MADPRVNVQITGDASGVKRAADQAENELQQVGRAAEKVSTQTGKLGRAGGGLSNLTKSVGALRTGVAGLAAGAVVAGLNKLSQEFDRVAETAAGIQNAASGVGVAVEEFQALTTVFAQFGLDSDAVSDVFTELNIKLGEAARGTTTAIDAFNDLGVSFRDAEGNIRSNVEVFGDLFDAIDEGVTPEKISALNDLLGGDNARKALPLLQATREEYQSLVDLAAENATDEETLETLTAARAENLATAAEKQADINRLAAALAPLIQGWNEAVGGFIDFLADSAEAVADFFTPPDPSAFEASIDQIRDSIRELGEEGGLEGTGIVEELERLEQLAQLTGFAPLKDELLELLGAAREAAGGLGEMGPTLEQLGAASEGAAEDLGSAAENADALQEAINKLVPKESIESLSTDIEALNAVISDPEAIEARAQVVRLTEQRAAAEERLKTAVRERVQADREALAAELGISRREGLAGSGAMLPELARDPRIRGRVGPSQRPPPEVDPGVDRALDEIEKAQAEQQESFLDGLLEALRTVAGNAEDVLGQANLTPELGRLGDLIELVETSGANVFESLTGAVDRYVDSIVEANDVTTRFINTLFKVGLKGLLGGLLGVVTGGGFAAGFLGTLQGALGGSVSSLTGRPLGRATGGPVQAGHPYMVGEMGRELFVPNVSGTIVPNRQLAGAGDGRNVHINIHGRFDGLTVPHVRRMVRGEAMRTFMLLESGRSPEALAREYGMEETEWQ